MRKDQYIFLTLFGSVLKYTLADFLRDYVQHEALVRLLNLTKIVRNMHLDEINHFTVTLLFGTASVTQTLTAAIAVHLEFIKIFTKVCVVLLQNATTFDSGISPLNSTAIVCVWYHFKSTSLYSKRRVGLN